MAQRTPILPDDLKLTIEDGVPIPPRWRAGTVIVYETLDKLQVGQSFAVPTPPGKSAKVKASVVGVVKQFGDRRPPVYFDVRIVTEAGGLKVRTWRVKSPPPARKGA